MVNGVPVDVSHDGKCEHCGRPLQRMESGAYKVYRHPKRAEPKPDCCSVTCASAEYHEHTMKMLYERGKGTAPY